MSYKDYTVRSLSGPTFVGCASLKISHIPIGFVQLERKTGHAWAHENYLHKKLQLLQ